MTVFSRNEDAVVNKTKFTDFKELSYQVWEGVIQLKSAKLSSSSFWKCTFLLVSLVSKLQLLTLRVSMNML